MILEYDETDLYPLCHLVLSVSGFCVVHWGSWGVLVGLVPKGDKWSNSGNTYRFFFIAFTNAIVVPNQAPVGIYFCFMIVAGIEYASKKSLKMQLRRKTVVQGHVGFQKCSLGCHMPDQGYVGSF